VTAGDATQGPAADPVIVAAATQGPAAEASGKMTGPGAAQDHMTGMVADQIESCRSLPNQSDSLIPFGNRYAVHLILKVHTIAFFFIIMKISVNVFL